MAACQSGKVLGSYSVSSINVQMSFLSVYLTLPKDHLANPNVVSSFCSLTDIYNCIMVRQMEAKTMMKFNTKLLLSW